MINDIKSDFDSFLSIAHQKQLPQRLCVVVCQSSLKGNSGDQRISLMPVTCVDRPCEKINSFNDIIMSGGLSDKEWDVVCITVLLGANDTMATAIETNKRLDVMLELIRQGATDKLVVFDSNARHIKLEF